MVLKCWQNLFVLASHPLLEAAVLVFGLESSLPYGSAHMDFSITHQRNRERSEKTLLKECETTRFISSEVEIIDSIICMCAVNYLSLAVLFIMY